MEQAIAAVAVAIIAGLFGWGGAKFARRKEKADAAKTLVDTALALVEPLKIEVGILAGRLAVVESENARLVTAVAKLEIDNRNLRIENTTLRTRVSSLERQIVDLGHTPVNGSAIVTTQTTETVKTITQDAPPP